jgi:preprotein translocase subunit SecE
LVIMVSIVIGIFLFSFDQVFNVLLDLLLQAGG